ncbi:MAG TPA: hypothetical protein VHE30_04565 [Polyangiaceae bacterium]|nr:hypothetical protein [Polyangiaceae bacterium]
MATRRGGSPGLADRPAFTYLSSMTATAERGFGALLPLVLSLSSSLVAGCGANSAGVPEDLLRAVGSGGERPEAGAGVQYPPGPYGVRVGEVTADLCFDGWRDPKGASYDTSRFGRVCLSDFHADASARLLLVESCAIWCAACRAEYGGDGQSHPSLSEQLAARKARGFRVLGTLFQDGDSNPATPENAATWATAYSVDFPFVADPDHQLGLFTSANVAPFNLLLDTRTMKIVLALNGDEPSVLYGAVDQFLGAPPP